MCPLLYTHKLNFIARAHPRACRAKGERGRQPKPVVDASRGTMQTCVPKVFVWPCTAATHCGMSTLVAISPVWPPPGPRVRRPQPHQLTPSALSPGPWRLQLTATQTGAARVLSRSLESTLARNQGALGLFQTTHSSRQSFSESVSLATLTWRGNTAHLSSLRANHIAAYSQRLGAVPWGAHHVHHDNTVRVQLLAYPLGWHLCVRAKQEPHSVVCPLSPSVPAG